MIISQILSPSLNKLNSNINNKKWKYISSGTNVALPTNILEYDEVMFCLDYDGYPLGNIIFPTIHSYIADKNVTGICYIGGYYTSDNNFGQSAIKKQAQLYFMSKQDGMHAM